jgi:hypothetical protein
MVKKRPARAQNIKSDELVNIYYFPRLEQNNLWIDDLKDIFPPISGLAVTLLLSEFAADTPEPRAVATICHPRFLQRPDFSS